MLYLQKSFSGTLPFLPPSRYRLCPWRVDACLLLEDGTLASEAGEVGTGVHIPEEEDDERRTEAPARE